MFFFFKSNGLFINNYYKNISYLCKMVILNCVQNPGAVEFKTNLMVLGACDFYTNFSVKG